MVITGVFLAIVFLLQVVPYAVRENRRIASSVRRPREKFSDLRPIKEHSVAHDGSRTWFSKAHSRSADDAYPEGE